MTYVAFINISVLAKAPRDRRGRQSERRGCPRGTQTVNDGKASVWSALASLTVFETPNSHPSGFTQALPGKPSLLQGKERVLLGQLLAQHLVIDSSLCHQS